MSAFDRIYKGYHPGSSPSYAFTGMDAAMMRNAESLREASRQQAEAYRQAAMQRGEARRIYGDYIDSIRGMMNASKPEPPAGKIIDIEATIIE